jgi:flagellar L-ring protein precursor FlgH
MQKPRDAAGVAGSCFAEARISYGGRGQITDVQQARYGQQILNIIAPF